MNTSQPTPTTPPDALDHELAEYRGIYLCDDCGTELLYPANPQLCSTCELAHDDEA